MEVLSFFNFQLLYKTNGEKYNETIATSDILTAWGEAIQLSFFLIK